MTLPHFEKLEVPHTKLKEPIYSNLFVLQAKDKDNLDCEILSQQIVSFSIKENLELKFNLNQGNLTAILSSGMKAKKIIIKSHDREGTVQFELDFDVNYRNFMGIEGSYDSTGIMELTMNFSITSLYLTEIVMSAENFTNKIRLK
jgi:hypothetical protein